MKLGNILRHLQNRSFVNTLLQRTVERKLSLAENNVFTIQQKLLDNILRYATKYCPTYQEMAIESLKIDAFPTCDKHFIRTNFIGGVLYQIRKSAFPTPRDRQEVALESRFLF